MAGTQRSRRLFIRGAFAAALTTALAVLALARTRAADWLESGAYDARVQWSAKKAAADRSIVIIDIDNASLEAFKGPNLLGRWPWPRKAWTGTIRYIAPGKPRAIVFDAIFGGSESPQADANFAAAIRDAGNVILGYTFNPAETTGNDEEVRAAARLKLLEREGSPAGRNSLGEPFPQGQYILNVPLDELAQSAAGLGGVNAVIDHDGVTRSVALAYRFGDKTYPSLSARTVDVVEGKVSTGFERVGRNAMHNGWRVPVNSDGRLMLAWHGDSFTYERIPIWQIICSIYPRQCAAQKVYFKPDYFRDRIVLIGASATGSYEVRPTPFEEAAPGFMTHVTAIDNLLHREGIRVAPRWFLPVAVLVMAFTGAAVLVRFASASLGLLIVLVLFLAYSGMAFIAYAPWHLWLPLVAPVAALVISFASSSAIRYATTGRELRRTRGTLDRYMAPQLVAYVLDNLDNIQFAGDKRELTILFSDVRNFTGWTEKSDALELIAMLNEYLTEMTDVIFKYDGVVDKFIGDGILAYWGAFTPGKNHAVQAARAALEMFERLKVLNQRWQTQGRPCIDIGVGINTGEVIFGNVGAGKKIEFTVIGDPVNLAARLESLNKEKHTHIIVSEFALTKLGSMAQVRSLGGVTVKGKTVETAIYELQGLASEAAPATVQAAHSP
jgi:adenylate cyclase